MLFIIPPEILLFKNSMQCSAGGTFQCSAGRRFQCTAVGKLQSSAVQKESTVQGGDYIVQFSTGIVQ